MQMLYVPIVHGKINKIRISNNIPISFWRIKIPIELKEDYNITISPVIFLRLTSKYFLIINTIRKVE